MKFFRYDSGFWSAMERVFDWMVLNLLWLVTSLPVVTVGASTAALTEVSRRMALGEEPFVFKSYFRAWAKHWKTATALWAMLAVTAGWLLLSLRICFVAGSAWFLPVAVVEGALLFAVVLSIPYALRLCTQSRQGIREIVKQAVVAALRHLPWSVVLAVVAWAPWVVTLLVPQALPYLLLFWLFLGVGSLSFLQQKVFERLEKAEPSGLLNS